MKFLMNVYYYGKKYIEILIKKKNSCYKKIKEIGMTN